MTKFQCSPARQHGWHRRNTALLREFEVHSCSCHHTSLFELYGPCTRPYQLLYIYCTACPVIFCQHPTGCTPSGLHVFDIYIFISLTRSREGQHRTSHTPYLEHQGAGFCLAHHCSAPDPKKGLNKNDGSHGGGHPDSALRWRAEPE